MKNIMYALDGLCLLAGPVFGQAQVAEIATAAVKKAVKTAPKRVILKTAKKTPAVEKKAVNGLWPYAKRQLTAYWGDDSGFGLFGIQLERACGKRPFG